MRDDELTGADFDAAFDAGSPVEITGAMRVELDPEPSVYVPGATRVRVSELAATAARTAVGLGSGLTPPGVVRPSAANSAPAAAL